MVRSAAPGSSAHDDGHAAQYSPPPPKSHSARARQTFFSASSIRPCDVSGLEGLEDRPDFQERVDASGVRGDGIAVFVADALPSPSRRCAPAPWPRYGAILVGGASRHRVAPHARITARGDHERGGQRAQLQPDAWPRSSQRGSLDRSSVSISNTSIR